MKELKRKMNSRKDRCEFCKMGSGSRHHLLCKRNIELNFGASPKQQARYLNFIQKIIKCVKLYV